MRDQGKAARALNGGAEPLTADERKIVGVPRPHLSVVIPVHNEAENIVDLIEEITSALAGAVDFEIIVVDDGSSDDSAPRVRGAAESMAVLRLVRHARRRGQSAALLSGVRAARGPWIATLDGDGQNDPADIPALLAARDKAAESGQALQLIGGRRVNRRDRWLKRFSSKVANAVRRRLLGDATPDTGCGLKLFPRAAFLALPHFDHFHRFLPALIQRQGGAVISVDVSHRPRRAGRSHYGVFDRLWVGLFDLVGVMWLQRRAMGPDDPGAGAPKE
jgi:dolichol-phosphate mannosyltransferase